MKAVVATGKGGTTDVTVPIILIGDPKKPHVGSSLAGSRWGDAVEEDGKANPQNPAAGHSPVAVEKPKSWAAIAAGNRDVNKGLQLKYYPPADDGIIDITESDLEAGKELWKNAVIGQFLGAKPTFKEVVGFVNRAWRGIQIPRVHFLKPGIFLFNFQSQKRSKKFCIEGGRIIYLQLSFENGLQILIWKSVILTLFQCGLSFLIWIFNTGLHKHLARL